MKKSAGTVVPFIYKLAYQGRVASGVVDTPAHQSDLFMSTLLYY